MQRLRCVRRYESQAQGAGWVVCIRFSLIPILIQPAIVLLFDQIALAFSLTHTFEVRCLRLLAKYDGASRLIALASEHYYPLNKQPIAHLCDSL